MAARPLSRRFTSCTASTRRPAAWSCSRARVPRRRELSALFASREMRKTYLAVAEGTIDHELTIESPIGGKDAHTDRPAAAPARRLDARRGGDPHRTHASDPHPPQVDRAARRRRSPLRFVDAGAADAAARVEARARLLRRRARGAGSGRLSGPLIRSAPLWKTRSFAQRPSSASAATVRWRWPATGR